MSVHACFFLHRGFANKVDKKIAQVAAAGLGLHSTVRTVTAIELRGIGISTDSTSTTADSSSSFSSSSINSGYGGPSYIDLDFYLDGALYKMVRNVVGAMLAISSRRLDVSVIEAVLQEGVWSGGEKHKTLAMPAPAHGLTLEQVFYGNEIYQRSPRTAGNRPP